MRFWLLADTMVQILKDVVYVVRAPSVIDRKKFLSHLITCIYIVASRLGLDSARSCRSVPSGPSARPSAPIIAVIRCFFFRVRECDMGASSPALAWAVFAWSRFPRPRISPKESAHFWKAPAWVSSRGALRHMVTGYYPEFVGRKPQCACFPSTHQWKCIWRDLWDIWYCTNCFHGWGAWIADSEQYRFPYRENCNRSWEWITVPNDDDNDNSLFLPLSRWDEFRGTEQHDQSTDHIQQCNHEMDGLEDTRCH